MTDQNELERMRRVVVESRRIKKAICPICDKSYPKNRPWQKFCSESCRNKWHTIQQRKG